MSPDPDRESAPRLDSLLSSAVVGLGLLAAALVGVNETLLARSVRTDAAALHAAGRVQLLATLTHLWVEERVTGDVVDVPQIWANLDEARRLALGLQAGEGPAGPVGALSPTASDGTAELSRTLAERLAEFRSLSLFRLESWERGEPVGIGSPVDEQYDRVFEDLRRSSLSLEALLVQRQHADQARARKARIILLVGWVGVIALTAFALRSREGRRRRAELALDNSRRQLLHAQKMEAVGRLAGGLSHDINNYLAAVRAQAERLRRTPHGDATAAKAESIIRSVDRASTLLKRLLAFSRRQPVKTDVVDLNGVVRDLEGLLARLLGDDVSIVLDLEDSLSGVEIDPSQLEQVVLNLVVNARDAMPGGGRIEVSSRAVHLAHALRESRPRLESGSYVQLAVADEGGGVAEAIRDEIFEPFFTTRPERGSGLGLSTVYGIVESHGGGIVVGDKEAGGAVFSVFLPDRGLSASRVELGEPEESESAPGGSRVLLVEDNDEVREAVTGLLEDLGCRVAQAAGTGEEAIEWFSEEADGVDVVLTDVVMPGMGGSELARRLRELDPEIAVVFMTGYTEDATLRRGLGEHARLLLKPFSASELEKALTEVGAQDRSAPGGSEPTESGQPS